MFMPTLQTKHLVLRSLRLGDAHALQRHFNDWRIIQHMTMRVPWPYPDDGAECFIREHCLPAMEDGRMMCWVLVPRDESEAVGLLEYRVGEGLADNRGFWVAHPYQGRGYMTEAVTAFQDYVFAELDVPCIHVCNAIDNAASRRVKEKTGAVRVGQFEQLHHSGTSICERWKITREHWLELRAGQG